MNNPVKIKNYSNYLIYKNGDILNLKSGKKVKHVNDRYIRVHMRSDDNVFKILLLHRVLAEAFLKNENQKKEVNHKDGNKHNNSIENLEWVTPSENRIHSFKNGLQKPSEKQRKAVSKRKISKYDYDFIKKSNKTNRELAKLFDVHISTISTYKKLKSYEDKAYKKEKNDE